MLDLTILISCCEEDKLVERSILENYEILVKYPLVIMDKKGGDKFISFEQQGNMNIQYFDQNTSFWFARRFGLEFVKTKYVLCLDVDTVLPPHYVESALSILESKSEVGAVALDYAAPFHQGHLAFGTSIWRTEQLKELYDWRLKEVDQSPVMCECRYMWHKLDTKGLKIETLPMEAIHMKEIHHQKIYKGEQPYSNGVS
jgi:hypothetical protein